MTEEQRRQAAAQRCAELANETSYAKWGPEDFTTGAGVQAPFFNAILELDELARKVDGLWTRLPQSLVDAAKPHILPQPKPSPVERLAVELWGGSAHREPVLEAALHHLGLQLKEIDRD